MADNVIKELFNLVYPYENLNKNISHDEIWEQETLCAGLPGTMLFICDYLKKNEIDGSIDVYIEKMIESYNNLEYIDLSLFSGLSGVASTLAIIDYTKYKFLIDQTTEYILDNLKTFTDAIDEDNLKFQDYDLMAGLCGILNYLIYYYKLRPRDNVLKKIKYSICTIISIYDNNKFYVKSKYFFSEAEKISNPNGGYDLGLSHGITGILHVLTNFSQINECNYVNKYKTLIYNDLKKLSYNMNQRLVWPQVKTNDFNKDAPIFFDSWCYGSPSIIYHLYKVAKEMNNYKDMYLFEESMNNIAKNIKGISSPSFCHGYAGLLTIFIEFNKLVGENIIGEKTLTHIKDKIMSFYRDDDFPFYEELYDYDKNKSEWYKNLGLLTGTSGIGLSLLHFKDSNSLPWTKIFTL
ncbi:hypothetical protein MXL82_10015 [Staphylococcus gallinarum]|uniref:lanthionine synthetase LanC family protein n=1 Tax=Staphylococcus gallinarum TaxID=1293 RepID=UPI002DB58329|nr:lanthionine synthetase LanC family protein [Staphylococcus gallinarum]MEB6243532.1 hypothetical protein [Staphylococcus gallinarum]MEB6296572.1 hypothetical protein [Staphylococcus gallinarum]